MSESKPQYAARLNSFRVRAEQYWPGKNRITTRDLLSRAATVPGLNAADLNYPDHFSHDSARELRAHMDDIGMALNGLAMRYYSDPRFKPGALMNPDAGSRQAAIDLTKRGLDALAEMGGDLMTLWLGQDGFDYSFQADYRKMWDDSLAALAEIADHNPALHIALEYKPNEPRAYSLMPDVGTNLLALQELRRANTGITIDFAHVLYADEMPAHTVTIVNRYARLLGVQMNDGYGKRDDGLIAGTVHPVQTVELLVELARCDYRRAVYFDTFPDVSGLDPVAETATNIALVEKLRAVAATLVHHAELAQAIERHDAAVSQRLVADALYRES